jgi:DNA-binding ferritin-like protein
MNPLDQLINLVFGDADAAHKQHLATETLQEHEALGEFYSSVRDAVDSTAEAIIAIGQVPSGEPDMLARLQNSFRELESLRPVCDDVKPIENLFDNIGAAYLKAIYKMTRLGDK